MTTLRMSRPLRVLSWAGGWGEALRDEVSGPFQAATGVTVQAVRHVGLRLPDALYSALDAHTEPPVAVWWSTTPRAMRAGGRGLWEPLDELPVLRDLADRARLRQP